MKKLWVFGTSHCSAYNIRDKSWADILAQNLHLELVNLSQPATDNFFIYHSYLENLSLINSNDLIVIGWSHYSRKSFIVDEQNINQSNAIKDSIVYTTKTCRLMRGINPPSGIDKFLNLAPKAMNREYYDRWFTDYYSSYEQLCNQQSYMDSVELTCPGHYVPFFFSKESINNLRIPTNHLGYIVDFINDNNLMISKDDGHLNSTGHKLWAEHILKYVDINLNNLYN